MQDQYIRNAELVRAIDADTLILRVDLGYHVFTDAYVRLARINAPERNTDAGKQARDALVNYLTLYANRLQIKSTKTEKYGRWLGELWVTDSSGDQNINDWLVQNGFATSA